MVLSRILVAGIALLAFQTVSAQGTSSRLGTFTWDATSGAVTVHTVQYENNYGQLIVTLAVDTVRQGKSLTSKEIDYEQFGVWVLASDGGALPGFSGQRMEPILVTGGSNWQSVNVPFTFKWDRSIALSAVVVRAGDKYYAFPAK